MAIMSPLKPRMGKRTTICIAVVIWIVGIVLSGPMLVFATTYTQVINDVQVRVICYSEWPDGPTYLSFQEYV